MEVCKQREKTAAFANRALCIMLGGDYLVDKNSFGKPGDQCGSGSKDSKDKKAKPTTSGSTKDGKKPISVSLNILIMLKTLSDLSIYLFAESDPILAWQA